ncbi:hypothetical protein L9F63_008254, partial [Diploptera punctata]
HRENLTVRVFCRPIMATMIIRSGNKISVNYNWFQQQSSAMTNKCRYLTAYSMAIQNDKFMLSPQRTSFPENFLRKCRILFMEFSSIFFFLW